MSAVRALAAITWIVGGSVDTTRPDVLLLQDDTLAGFRCTATLIAPNLVITARHCVGKRAVPAATTLCKGGPTDEGAQALPVYQGDVDAAPMYLTSAPGAPLLARATTVFDDGSTTTCGHDLALIGLDRSLPAITPSPLRRTPPAQRDALLAMGFGWTDRNATVNATVRMAGTTSVLALGPVVYAFKPFGDPAAASQPVAIAGGEIGVEGITMTGDSGGPAFDVSGRLAAIVSRGFSDAYYGPGTFTTIAAHLATIDAALVATGNAPITDAGAPVADASVPACAPCVPPAPTAADASPESGPEPAARFGEPRVGCSLGRAPHASLPGGAAAALALALAVARTIGRSRRDAGPIE